MKDEKNASEGGDGDDKKEWERELDKRLTEDLDKAETARQVLQVFWSAMDELSRKYGKDDYEVDRERKLQFDRNTAAAIAGVSFVCLLTIISLETTSWLLDVSFLAHCISLPIFTARMALLEHYLRSNGDVEEDLHSLADLVFGTVVSVLFLLGIVFLLASYSYVAAIVTSMIGVFMGIWIIRLVGSSDEEDEADEST